MEFIYVIAGIVGLGIAILAVLAFIAQIKTHQLIKEVIESGAIPGMAEARAKKQAREIISIGYIQDAKRANEISQVLSMMKNDREAAQLINQLTDLQKNQSN